MMNRRPFLNVHRLAVFGPVWVLGLPLAVGAASSQVADWLGYAIVPALAFPLWAVVILLYFWVVKCPRCDALTTSDTGNYFWGWHCAFFAHEECPKCGLDLCAITPWDTGIVRQRKDWIAALPQPRKLWIQLGALRIIATRVAVLAALIYGVPALSRAAETVRTALGG